MDLRRAHKSHAKGQHVQNTRACVGQQTRYTTIMRANRLIFLLSLAGIAIAVYVLQSFIRQTPIVCVNTGCETVRKSASSYILGLAAFGVVFVSWFTYTEIFVIKAVCTWCAISAVNMFIIFFLVLISQIRLIRPI